MAFGAFLYYLTDGANKRLRFSVQVSPPVPARDPRTTLSAGRLGAVGIAALLVLGGCTTGQPAGPGEFNDPYEGTNRKIHEFNKAVDRAIYRPVSNTYGTVLPQPVRRGVNNFSRFIDLPRQVVNDVLQGRIEDGLHNSFRFMVNGTFGIVGLVDVATGLGMESRDTDFGATLHTWGVGEGAYVAVPFFGPSTQRDLTGDIVDLFTNPVSYVLSAPESYYGPAAQVGENIDYRYTFRDTLNQVLDESADSYAQARLIYLDARRFELGDQGGGAIVDPYGDAEAPAGPAIIDPYEELYGE